MSIRSAATALLALIGAVSACTLAPVKRAPAGPGYAVPSLPEATDPFPNWPLPPDHIEDLILNHEHVVKAEHAAGAGTTGAREVTLNFPDADASLDLKWKQMDTGWKPFWGRLDGVNNSPRKEIAAWKIQSLFLEPESFVVPLSLGYCVPSEEYRADGLALPALLPGSDCVLGVVSVWLRDVTLPDPLLDDERFVRDYVYARFLADLNLFTFLVAHHDGREGNFLVSKDDARRQVFAIDNGVAFGGLFYNWFVANWNSLRVPALRAESVDRLRKLREEDVERQLGVVAQLELGDDGVYRNVPLGTNLDPDRGVRIEGGILQLGLTDDEIGDVWGRIRELIEDVDEGDVPVF